jgi:hypothetical protein
MSADLEIASSNGVFPEGWQGTFIVSELNAINGFEVKKDPEVNESIIGVH